VLRSTGWQRTGYDIANEQQQQPLPLPNFPSCTTLPLPASQKPTPFLPLSFVEQFHFPQLQIFLCTADDLTNTLVSPLVSFYQIQSLSQDCPPPKSLSFQGSEGNSRFTSLWIEVSSTGGAQGCSTSPRGSQGREDVKQ